MVLCVVCSDDQNMVPWHIEIPSDHQSKISSPSQNFYVITRNLAKRKKKKQRKLEEGKQGEGRVVVLGLFLM